MAAATGKVLVQVDKTVVRVTGITVRGLDTRQVESLVREALGGNIVRVIGVTGDSLEMDVYGLDEAAVLRAGDGLIRAVSMAEGITAADVAQMDSVTAIRSVPVDAVPEAVPGRCARERWL
ncbi:hypothetical protein LJC26_06960 [Desulfovibrio sp. OttesenSCG-928-O18]|nr:hypothetical protein [Desulfovibrio sp. OttesenSCG-928-O18]